MALTKENVLICDFCGKSQYEVKKLINGQKNICICNECIVLSVEILINEPKPKKINLEEGDKDDN